MEEIINSVMQSPENTNPNVLRSQLQGISGGSGGGVFVVNITGDSPSNAAFDKTASEVFAAKQTMPVVVTMTFNGATVFGDLVIAVKQGTNYTFLAYFRGNDLSQFTAASDDSYPTIQA